MSTRDAKCCPTAHAEARSGAEETYNNCLMSQLEDMLAAEDADDMHCYVPAITDEELFAEIAGTVGGGAMSEEEYLDCMRMAAEEANWVYNVVYQWETRMGQFAPAERVVPSHHSRISAPAPLVIFHSSLK